MRWFVQTGDALRGPITAAEVLASAQRGELTAATLVRRDGETQWQPLEGARAQLTHEALAPVDPFSQPAPPLRLTSDKPQGGRLNGRTIRGLVMLAGGLVLTAGTYVFALVGGGGVYFVTYGLIIAGVVQVVMGFTSPPD